MIISCEKCNKSFNIQDHLIPDEGRLLQCGSCNHKWFFRKTSISVDNNKNIDLEKKIIIENNNQKEPYNETPKKPNNSKEKSLKKLSNKNNLKLNIPKYIIVFIISLAALIILADTFKFSLENYLPGINFILNNLYETLKDLTLFFKDLIN